MTTYLPSVYHGSWAAASTFGSLATIELCVPAVEVKEAACQSSNVTTRLRVVAPPRMARGPGDADRIDRYCQVEAEVRERTSVRRTIAGRRVQSIVGVKRASGFLLAERDARATWSDVL